MKAKIICFLCSLLFALPIYGQIGLDFSALDVKPHFIVGEIGTVGIGIEAEFGINLTNYILVAGSHFASDRTPIKYAARDRYDKEVYWSILGVGIFGRIHNDKEFPIDIGFRVELFIHSDESSNNLGGGSFTGVFVGISTPTKFKTKGEKKKRKMSVGLRLTAGTLSEPYGATEFGVLGDLWVRAYLNYK